MLLLCCFELGVQIALACERGKKGESGAVKARGGGTGGAGRSAACHAHRLVARWPPEARLALRADWPGPSPVCRSADSTPAAHCLMGICCWRAECQELLAQCMPTGAARGRAGVGCGLRPGPQRRGVRPPRTHALPTLTACAAAERGLLSHDHGAVASGCCWAPPARALLMRCALPPRPPPAAPPGPPPPPSSIARRCSPCAGPLPLSALKPSHANSATA